MPNKDRNTRNGLGGGALAAVLLAVILVIGGIFWAAANPHRRTHPIHRVSDSASQQPARPARAVVQSGGAGHDR